MTHPFASLGPTIIAALGATEVVTITRRAAGAHDEATGIWTPGASSTLEVDAVVQPVTPRDLQMLPEGERTKEAIALFTVAALVTSDVGSAVEADQVAWSSRTWRVALVEDWTAQAGYARAIATRVGP